MVDNFYDCSINANGSCIPRRDHKGEVPIENDLVTLIRVDMRGLDRLKVETPGYAKSVEQKVAMLLEFKKHWQPDRMNDFMILVAWPGKWSQDIFYVRGDLVDHYLKRLGWAPPLPPAAQQRIDDFNKQMEALKKQQAELDQLRRNSAQKMFAVRRSIKRMEREIDEVKESAKRNPDAWDRKIDEYDDYYSWEH